MEYRILPFKVRCMDWFHSPSEIVNKLEIKKVKLTHIYFTIKPCKKMLKT